MKRNVKIRQNPTPHPCRGMTKAQIRAFEQFAIGQRPNCTIATTDALVRANVLVHGEPQIYRDKFGRYAVPTYEVPLPVHAQWCQWCSEQKEQSARPRPDNTANPV